MIKSDVMGTIVSAESLEQFHPLVDIEAEKGFNRQKVYSEM
jgi:hypothetical protein